MTTAREFRSAIDMIPRINRNVIVVGGDPSDATLAQGSGCESELRIGFLNIDKSFAKNLPKFIEKYDAIILGDGGLQYINQLIEQIISEPR